MSIQIKCLNKAPCCAECAFQDNFTGGCIVLSIKQVNDVVLHDVGYQEFDDEWRNAREENRPLKWCPIESVEVTDCVKNVS